MSCIVRGNDHGRSKLTNDSVLAIRAGKAKGDTELSLAERFNVSRSTICHVLSGRTWGHVK